MSNMASPDFSVGGFLKFGMENTGKHFLKFLGLSVVLGVVSSVGYSIFYALMAALLNPGSLAGLLLQALFGDVMLAIVAFVVVKNLLNLCHGRNMDFKMNPGAITNLAIFGALVWVAAFAFALTAGLLLFASPAMNIVLTIISSIIVIILGLMFLHVPYLIADRGMGVFGALRESAKMNKGRKMDIFWGFFLSNLALSLLCWLITLLLDIPLAALNINIDRNVYLMLLWVFIIPLAAFINIYPYLCLTGQLDEMQDAALEAENEADEID